MLPDRIPTGRLAMTLICLAISFAPAAKAQDLIGGFLGPVIEAGAGEVLNRAGGQVVEGALNRGGRTRFSGRRRILRRSSDRQRVPSQNVQPRPVYTQPTPTYSNPVPAPSAVQAAPSQPVEAYDGNVADPPVNEVPISQRTQANASPLDLALTHVLDQGPALAASVMQVEAEEVSQLLDSATLRQLHRSGQSEQVVAGFKAATRSQNSPKPRQEWMAKHENKALLGKSDLLAAIETSTSVSVFANSCIDLSFADRQSEIDALRAKISEIPPGVLGGEELALVAERVRNLRNIALLAELARVSGIERRQDLFARIHAAAIKADAPQEFVSLLTGFAVPIDTAPVPQTSISAAGPVIALHNPLDSQTPVRFTIEGQGEFTLQPGDIAAGNESVVIRFDNGKGNTKRYTLGDGFFQWNIKDGSWDIQKKTTVKFLVDASQSQLPFHYLFNGKPMVVGAGEVAEHSSTMPPRIDFDRGFGDGSVATKILNPGRFSVLVNPETGAFELYPIEDQSRVETATTRGQAVRAWRESVARVQNYSDAGPVDRRLDSLLNEIE